MLKRNSSKRQRLCKQRVAAHRREYLRVCISLNLQKSESSVNSVILNLLNNTTDHQISDRSQGSKSPSD